MELDNSKMGVKINTNTQQNALSGDKPSILPKPNHLVPPSAILEHELKLESPDRSGSPGDQTSRYVALITPATFNLGLKSPNGKKLYTLDIEVEEKTLITNVKDDDNNNNNNNNNDTSNKKKEDETEKDLNGNEDDNDIQRTLDDKILIESCEKKLDESYQQLEAAFRETDEELESDMSQELEPDSLEEIILKVPENCNRVAVDVEEKTADIVLTTNGKEKLDYSDDESDQPKKELVVPKIVLERVDVDGTIVNCSPEDAMDNPTENRVSNIQITLKMDNVLASGDGSAGGVENLNGDSEFKDDSGSVQPVLVPVEGSQPVRSPKKLFEDEEEGNGTEEPVETVKDLEARKLRALERERRRIIDNQVVRRKKIDYWAFANTSPPEFSEDQLIALAHEKGGVQVLAQVETNEDRETTHSPPPATPPPAPPTTVTVTVNECQNTEAPLLDDIKFPSTLDEDDREILRGALATEEGIIFFDEDGMPSLGAVDSASILENKERLRSFWEQRIMADQELKENGVSPPTSPTIVSLNGESKESTPTKAKSQEDIFKEAAVLEDCEPSPPDSLNENVPVDEPVVIKQEVQLVNATPSEPVVLTNGTAAEERPANSTPVEPETGAKVLGVDEGQEGHEVKVSEEKIVEKEAENLMEESALDREVRLALEREEQLKKEHAAAVVESSPESSLTAESESEQPEDFPVHHVALAPTVEVESEEEREEAGSKVDKVTLTTTTTVEKIQVKENSKDVVEETIVSVKEETIREFSESIKEIQRSEPVSDILSPEPFNDEVVTVGEVIFVDADGNATQIEEIPQQPSKPQIIGETYRQQVKDEIVAESPIEPTCQSPLFTMSETITPIANGVASPTTTTTPTLQNGTAKPAESPLLKNERPTYNPNSDSKIALEIREMKEREEELRMMRETILRETANNATNKASVGSVSSLSNSSRQSEQGSVHSDDGHETLKLNNGQNGVSGSSSPVQTPISRTISLDNLHPGQPYNIGYAFGHRRKDGVKVKPLADSDEDKQVFKVLKESPIEREIRLTKEREEQLKREKEILIQESTVQRPQTLDVVTTSLGKLSASKTSPFQVPLKSGVANGDTQRILATSRIQQEIEEQTEREKALRASGKIQTISQERTDAKVAGSRLRESSGGSPDSAIVLSSSGHTPLSPSPSLSDSEKSSTNSTPAISNGGVNGVYVNGNGNQAKSPSPANSTASGGVKVNGNFPASRRFSNPQNGRNVNMQRFIASKGKEVVSAFSPFNSSSKEKSHSVLSLHHVNGSASDAYQMKPPKVPKDLTKNGALTNGTSSPVSSTPNGVPKRSLTAENKIQEELKEMQAREDELRQQRARLLGLSQPNLCSLDDEDLTDGPQQTSNGHEQPATNGTNGTNGVPTLERASSNPNLLDDSVEFVGRNKKNTNYGGPRRRSTLIEQWEQRIQSSEAKS